jgi:hypothetical protein
LPTSSWIFAVADADDPLWARSFAFQEAVIPAEEPARELIAPGELGRYLVWLHEKLTELVQVEPQGAEIGTPIKALKRSLSLMLLMGYDDRVDALLERLRLSELSAIVKRIRLEELESMFSDLSGSAPESFRQRLESLREDVRRHRIEDFREALEAARDLSKAMLKVFEADLAAYA